MDTGGVVKVTSFDESNQTINNAFDKAIADHAEKMKHVTREWKHEKHQLTQFGDKFLKIFRSNF